MCPCYCPLTITSSGMYVQSSTSFWVTFFPSRHSQFLFSNFFQVWGANYTTNQKGHFTFISNSSFWLLHLLHFNLFLFYNQFHWQTVDIHRSCDFHLRPFQSYFNQLTFCMDFVIIQFPVCKMGLCFSFNFGI